MHWTGPSENASDNSALETRLWDGADQFLAKRGLKSQGYSPPVFGLNLHGQTANIRRMCDLLLPRLHSGQTSL